MKYYYASRTTKDGDYLMTSYGNAASQKKYGGADAKTFDGLRGVVLAEDGSADFNDEGEGLIVRSYMKSAQRSGGDSGKFRIWGKLGGAWKKTQFAFHSYGEANTLMKALAGSYEDIMVTESGVEVSSYEVNHGHGTPWD